jgi:hypothetical protein
VEDVRFVGLDVHTERIAIGMAEPGRGEAAVLATIPNDTGQLTERLRRMGKVKCCFEAPSHSREPRCRCLPVLRRVVSGPVQIIGSGPPTSDCPTTRMRGRNFAPSLLGAAATDQLLQFDEDEPELGAPGIFHCVARRRLLPSRDARSQVDLPGGAVGLDKLQGC